MSLKMNNSSKTQTRNSLCDSSRGNLDELSGVWETVDRLKEGLARTERKLATAGKEKWRELKDVSAQPELEESVEPKTFVRKVCKIDSQRRRYNPDRPQKKLQKLEEPNWDSDWDEYFHRQKSSTAHATKEEENDSKYVSTQITRDSTNTEKSKDKLNRLSAGYDPSQRKNKIYRLHENLSSNALSKSKGTRNDTVRDNAKDCKNEIEGRKSSRAASCPTRTKKIDNLQKVGRLVEKQQMKKRFLRYSAIASKPSDAIIPISMASQSQTQQLANPQRKVAFVRSVPMSLAPSVENRRSVDSELPERENQREKGENKLIKKSTVTKKTAKISQNVHDYIICPSSWKKGKALCAKEFGTSDLKENERNKNDGADSDSRKLDASIRDDGEKSSSSRERMETMPGLKIAKTKTNKRVPAKQESERERLPKERHYNAATIRDYITKQRRERVHHLLTEKQQKEREKEERKNKLQQLQRLQKKLAKVSIVRKSESEQEDLDEYQPKVLSTEPREIKIQDLLSEENCESPEDRANEWGLTNETSEFKSAAVDEAESLVNRKIEAEYRDKITERAIKLSSIHATAMSLQLQMANETNRIARMFDFNNDATGEHELLVVSGEEPTTNADIENAIREHDEGGRGEPQRLIVPERIEYETRHEKVVQSRSQFSVFEGADLPGIANLVKHAKYITDDTTETSAACKIQACYRGYRVRRSLQWRFVNRDGSGTSGDVLSRDTAVIKRGPFWNFCKSTHCTGVSSVVDDEFEQYNARNVKLKLQAGKPDPYNIINTLQRTIGKFNCDIERRPETILSDLNAKSADVLHRDDCEGNGQREKQNETLTIEHDRNIDARTSASIFARLPASISAPDKYLQTSLESTAVETMKSFPENQDGCDQEENQNRSKTTEGINENHEFEMESLSGGSLDSSHDSNSKSIDELVLPDAVKYSPSSLKLWMSSELVYLESLEDSLHRVTHAERIQGVTAAQQNAASLTQVLQAEQQRRIEKIEKMHLERQGEITEHQKLLIQAQKRHEEALAAAVESVALVRSQASSAINSSTHNLMQTQAEAARVTADAAKQLAQANLATVELNRELQSKIDTKLEVGNATSNAIAAVTSILYDLQKNPRRRARVRSSLTDSDETKTEADKDQAQESSTIRSSASETNALKPTAANNQISSSSECKFPIPEIVSVSGSDWKDKINTNEDSNFEASVTECEATLSEGSIDDEDNRTDSVTYSSKFENTNSNGSSDNSSPNSFLLPDQTKKNFDVGSPTEQLFANKDSLKNFTLEMVRQYTKKEDLRSKQQMELLKLREKSLVEKTKAEVAWLELQKQQLRNQGEEEKMPPLRKRQRWLMLRLQQEQNEIKRLREAQLMANQERQMLLQQQQQIAHMRQSTKQILGKIREISPGMQLPSLKSLPSSTRSLNVSPKTSVTIDTMSSSHTEDEVVDTQSDIGEGREKVDTANTRNSKSDSEIPLESASKANSLATRVLQGLKKFEMNKQKLTARELKLLEKGKDGKNVLAWRETTDTDDKIESLDEESDRHKQNNNADLVTILKAADNSTSGLLTISTDEEIKKSAIEIRSNSIQEEIKTEPVVDYGNSFETTSKSSEKQPVPNLALRLPLSPRTQHKRRDSSGSEDSLTISQSETVSDLSDIEGRVHALKEELRRRKQEADKLRKEQKRRNKERLKAQEASLIKQIEAYDRFIWQTKSELDHELEVDSKSSVKPQIRRPQVAESRHVNKIQVPLINEVKDEGTMEENQQSSKYTIRDDDTIASSLSELGTNEKSILTIGDKLDSESDNEESTSDSVKTVTEKTEEKSTNELKIQSSDDSRLEKQDGSIASKSRQSTVMQNDVVEDAISAAILPKEQEEKSLSDDETMAEEIEDEEIEIMETDGNENAESENQAETTDVDVVREEGNGSSNDNVANIDAGGNDEEEEKFVHCVRTASVPSKFQDSNRNNDRFDLSAASTLVDMLLSRELQEAIRVITDEVKKRHDSLREQQCDFITNSCFSELLADNLNTVFHLHSRLRRRLSPLSIGDRVKSILNEIEVKCTERNERIERTNLNDILTLSSPTAYNDVLTSPEGTTTTNSESPAREESPLSRSSSSVQQEDFPTCDADGEEWFEDEMQEGSNFYQIYPCKQYYYIREIPNKPPPPYTPPPSSAALTTTFVSSLPQIPLSQPVTPELNSKDEYVETYASHTETQVQMLVARAVTLFHESILEDVSSIVPAEDYFHIAATDDDTNESHRAFRQFLFDLSGELLYESLLRRRESCASHPPWMKPKWISRTRSTLISNDSSDIVRCVQYQVIALISAETIHSPNRGSSICIGRKKQDRVDEILVKELREEELNWINYDQDEVTVKVQLADSILNCLLKETARLIINLKVC